MLTPHNPLKVIALTMGVKESIFPIGWGLLEGDIFILFIYYSYIIHFHQVCFNLQMLTDLAQANGRSAFVQQQEKTLEPTIQYWQHCEEPIQVPQQTQGLLCCVRWNCQCK